ncbi:hypothetical protein Tco_1417276 [Tanacetum coccineum]
MSANDNFSLHDDEELSLHDDASLDGSVPASNKGDAPAKPPQIITTNTLSNIKLPVLQKDDYDTWAMEMEHYLEYIDNEVWKVIQNGNSKKRVTKGKDGVYRVLPPTTQEEQFADEKERKARTLLLMAVPKDHLSVFRHDDAKEYGQAIKEHGLVVMRTPKKMQKADLKQQSRSLVEQLADKGLNHHALMLSSWNNEWMGIFGAVSDASSTHYSTCQSNDSDGELGTMAREAALKSKRIVHTDVRQATPAWTNTNRAHELAKGPILKIIKNYLKGSDTFEEVKEYQLGKICDKKLNVLFTEKECFVVSSDFKMPDANQGLAKVGMFDLDYLTDSMNYIPVSLQNQANPAGSKEVIDIDVQTEEAEELLVVSSTSRKAAVSENIAKKKTHSPKQPSSTPISKSADDIMVFRKELDALALKHLGPVPTTAPTSTNPVNTGSGNLNTGFEQVTPGNMEAISPSANHEEEVFSDADDDEMPEIRIYDKSSEGIFEQASYDDDGIITDFNNLPDEVDVTTNPTLRIHNAHPQSQILGDPNTPVQTRSSLKKITEAHALVSYIQAQQRSNHKDQQHCLFACFLSQSEPRKVSEALEDGSWVEAMQEELLQFKLQQVWVLVDLPNGAKVIEKHGYKRGTMLVQVYVDDIIFGSTNKSWCDEFEALMQSRFQMSSMGELTFSLGPKTESSRTGRNLSYLKTSNSKRLLLTQCRQEIIKYHKGKPNLGYVYPRESPLDLEAISDSDYGGSILDRKPQQVVVNFLSKTYSWPCSHLRSPVRHTKPIPFSSVHLHLSCQTPQDHQFPISAMTQSWRSRSGESHDDERTGAKIDDLIGHRQIRHDDIVLLFRQHRQTDWGGGALSLEVLQWMKATLMVGSERQYSRIDLRSDTQRIELDAMYWYGLRNSGKGKAIVTEEQVAHSLIDLSKKKRTTDQFILVRRDQTPHDSTTGPSSQPEDDTSEKVIHESSSTSDSERTESETEAAAPKGNKDQGEVDSSRVTSGVSIPVSTQGQAGSDPEKAHEALAGPDPEPMQEDQTGSNSGKLHLITDERVIEDNPESHSGSMSSMKNLEDTDNFGDQFLYDKPTEDDQEKSKVVDESDSTIPDPSHQTVTTNPPVIAPEVLSFSSTKPSFSLVHTSFNATQKATNKSPHLPRDHFILRLLARMARLEQEMSEIKKTGSS